MTPLSRFSAAATVILSVAFGADAADPEATRRAHALFARHWEESARLYPIFATFRGDHRYNDRHNDRSAEGIAREERYWRTLLADLQALKSADLSKQDRLSLQLLETAAAQAVERFRHAGLMTYTVHASAFPFHGYFAAVMQSMPMDTVARAEQMLARMAAYPRHVDDEIVHLRRGMELGWVPSKPLLMRAMQQIDAQLQAPPEKSAYAGPWHRLGKDIPAETRDALRRRGIEAIARDV
ncbi:MAG TPA: DUF885 family protein, partial [Acetobacteraceae bacterium]|nr:DUF885 family protein [Acetobacteraceae bacterium]